MQPAGSVNPETESLLVQTRRLLHRFDYRARKRLGQHFLIDEGVLRTIVAAAELGASDVVMEVGPGLGVLTRELAKEAGYVIAIELDNKLAAILAEEMLSFQNVAIVNRDILQVEPVALLRQLRPDCLEPATGSYNYKMVANLPYYITSAVLRHFLEASVRPGLMVLMVQKEVARAIVAQPGEMSLLGVSVQFYGWPRIVSEVPSRCFYPAPEVDSAILRIEPYPEPLLPVNDEESFFNLVRAGFCASRKQLVNSLAQGLKQPKAEVAPLLEKADISPRRRAETLSLDEWTALWQVFTQDNEYVDSTSAG